MPIESNSGFNPHTHEGCDFVWLLRRMVWQVSIHTPTKGVTSLLDSLNYLVRFQSTHPRRVWPNEFSEAEDAYKFQSTHPRRVWPEVPSGKNYPPCVSIHTPTKGVTWFNGCKYRCCKFQSTHPRRVWQISALRSAMALQFQSTHPRRVWRDLRKQKTQAELFQSTHPRRVWPASLKDWQHCKMFQSTHPRRVWPFSPVIRGYMCCFNPHTHEGCDLPCIVACSHKRRFNPHTHEGCDFMFCVVSSLWAVSIHTPTKGVT